MEIFCIGTVLSRESDGGWEHNFAIETPLGQHLRTEGIKLSLVQNVHFLLLVSVSGSTSRYTRQVVEISKEITRFIQGIVYGDDGSVHLKFQFRILA